MARERSEEEANISIGSRRNKPANIHAHCKTSLHLLETYASCILFIQKVKV